MPIDSQDDDDDSTEGDSEPEDSGEADSEGSDAESDSTTDEAGEDGSSDTADDSEGSDESGEGEDGDSSGTEDSGSDDSSGSEDHGEDSEESDSGADTGNEDGTDTGDSGTGDGDGGSGTGDGDGDSGTGDSGTGDDTGTEPPEPCPAQTHLCLGVPENWDGPVALGTREWSQSLPLCVGDYGQSQGDVLFAGLSAPEAACTCECGPTPTPPTCEVTVQTVLDCTSLTVEETFTFGTGCTAVGPIPVNQAFVSTVEQVAAGTCEIANEDTVVPERGWSTKAEVCLLTADPFPGQCGSDEQCLPRPSEVFAERVCIYRSGRFPCPDPFAETEEWFLDELHEIPDDRGCSACACNPAGADCGTTFRLHDLDSCMPMDQFSVPLDGECVEWPYAQTLRGASYSDDDKTLGTCEPAGAEPIGEAVPQLPVTVCCL